MSRVKVHDKRVNITYVYESDDYWVTEKKGGRSKRRLVAKIDPITGQEVPTDGRMKKAKAKKELFFAENDNSVVETKYNKNVKLSYGATYVLSEAAKRTKLIENLMKCFPKDYKKILSIVYYFILVKESPLYEFDDWADTHLHPYGKAIPSGRSTELFQSIEQNDIDNFFSLNSKQVPEDAYSFYDTSTFSSYSEELDDVDFGKSKEDNRLPQFNLSLILNSVSGLPVYYRNYAGNIPDVHTINTLINDLDGLNINNVKIVMDKGFYRRDNIVKLIKNGNKFVISAKRTEPFVIEAIEKESQKLKYSYDKYYNSTFKVFSTTIPHNFSPILKKQSQSKSDPTIYPIYMHIYYDKIKEFDDYQTFESKLMKWQEELLTGKLEPKNKHSYKKYFIIEESPKGEKIISINSQAVKEEEKNHGYYVLLSNEKMDSITALTLYRNKDLIEKAFSDLKSIINAKRHNVSNNKSLYGKVFVEFIALILVSYIKKQIREAGLNKKYTFKQMFAKLDKIKCRIHSGKLKVCEILKEQIDILNKLGIEIPS